MIVIYTQDFTTIKKDADEAKELLLSIYGNKLGQEAYCSVKNASVGTSYQKYGGPLIKVVAKEEADNIRIKEALIKKL